MGGPNWPPESGLRWSKVDGWASLLVEGLLQYHRFVAGPLELIRDEDIGA
jgi:hypothetical protein